jgi:tetratricopeptide (TPR) repeat protein
MRETSMRNETRKRVIRFLAPRILAIAVTVFWAVSPVTATEVRFKITSDNVVEITGGTGKEVWQLRYGTGPNFGSDKPILANPEGNVAWFSNGVWLREIDTQKGTVIGRWRFPSDINRLTPRGKVVEVRLIAAESFRTVTLDPARPSVLYGYVPWPHWISLPIVEVQRLWKPLGARHGAIDPILSEIPEDQARVIIPQLEEAIRRDPMSPWFRVILGKLLRDVGDARSKAVLEEAVRVPTTDFTELFPISAYLDQVGEHEVARTAFDRGYKSFLELRNDPRLFNASYARDFLYPLPPGVQTLPPDFRLELMNRIYELAPAGWCASIAWQNYADELQRNGQAESARLWHERALDSEGLSLSAPMMRLARILDSIALGLLASILAAFIYFLVLAVRYGPQSRLDSATRRRLGALTKGFSWFSFVYWDRRQRLAFLTIVLAAWLAAGLAGGELLRGLNRLEEFTGTGSSHGNLADPSLPAYLETDWPKSPERDLLLALAYQEDGQLEKAERLYRSLPQFSESWNNLGVLLKEAGRADDARAAFERARQVEPNLAEAALNLGGPPQTLWTQLFHKYLPDSPMLVPPQRDHLLRALIGSTTHKIGLMALAGPFAYRSAPEDLLGAGPFWAKALDFIAKLVTATLSLVLVLALALLLVIPSRDVTQAPGKGQVVWEVLLPGTSPTWSYLGGMALAAWVFFIAQVALLPIKGSTSTISPLLWSSLEGILSSAYGVNVATTQILRAITPGWAWLYLAPAVLFAVNLILVLRARRRA